MREHRYSISHKMHLIDNAPMEQNQIPLVWDPKKKIWSEEGITVAEHLDAVPISDEEARKFLETGELSQDTLRRFEYEYPDPWEDIDEWDD